MKKEKQKNDRPGLIKVLYFGIKNAVAAPNSSYGIIAATNFFNVIITTAGVILNQRFVDSASEAVATGGGIMAIIMSLLVMLAFAVASCIVDYFQGKAYYKFYGNIKIHFEYLMHEKISRLPAIYFENTSKLTDMNKAEQGKWNTINMVDWFTLLVTYSVPNVIILLIYYSTLSPKLIIALFLAVIPSALTKLATTKLYKNAEDKTAPLRRKQSFAESAIKNRKFFKETRSLGAFGYFMDIYDETREAILKISKGLQIKNNLINLATNIINALCYSGVLYLLFTCLMNKEISVGAFAAVYLSLGTLFGSVKTLIINGSGALAEMLPHVENFVMFMEEKEEEGEDVQINVPFDIKVDNVSFSYPGATGEAIKNVSFDIKYGETIAIVGENGSGKTTLIKLLMGLYKPCKGDVLFNGISTRNIKYSSSAEKMSAVFQCYCHYHLSLRDNLILGDVRKEATDEEMRKACSMSGFSPDDEWLPDGFATVLSREFDGVDTSGGQRQRVAIARAFYRDSNMIVLDEPTAAIDPFEETKIYERFAALSKGKTSFIVTHRLGSVKLADRIIVMNNGTVDDIGTHDELMARGGEYRRMFEAQSQWYKDDTAAATI